MLLLFLCCVVICKSNQIDILILLNSINLIPIGIFIQQQKLCAFLMPHQSMNTVRNVPPSGMFGNKIKYKYKIVYNFVST